MKRIHKILLLIISLAGLACSVGLLSLYYPIPAVSELAARYGARYLWLKDVFSGYILFLCAVFLLLLLAALFVPSRSGDLVLVKSGGKIQFSRQAVESAVRYSFADVPGINRSQVKTKIKRRPEKTRVYVKLSLSDWSRLVELSETVQGRICSALQTSLGVTVSAIDIRVLEYRENQRQSGGAAAERSSGVVVVQTASAPLEPPMDVSGAVVAASPAATVAAASPAAAVAAAAPAAAVAAASPAAASPTVAVAAAAPAAEASGNLPAPVLAAEEREPMAESAFKAEGAAEACPAI